MTKEFIGAMHFLTKTISHTAIGVSIWMTTDALNTIINTMAGRTLARPPEMAFPNVVMYFVGSAARSVALWPFVILAVSFLVLTLQIYIRKPTVGNLLPMVGSSSLSVLFYRLITVKLSFATLADQTPNAIRAVKTGFLAMKITFVQSGAQIVCSFVAPLAVYVLVSLLIVLSWDPHAKTTAKILDRHGA